MKKLFLLLFAMIFLIGIVQGASYCCEKTVDGAWCQNVEDKNQCATGEGFSSPAATRCDSTSYCKLGTCIDSQKGICTPNTAQRTCENNNGYWVDKDIEGVEQCNKACCVLGNNGLWGTQTECTFLSALYGINTDFRRSIQSESECILLSTSSDRGACVYEEELVKKCKMTTKGKCKGVSEEFYEGILCSSETLGTICGPSTVEKAKTTCVEGEEQVYFVDTCGNIANIYDADRINNKIYWSKIYTREESCGYGNEDGNANSKICGNCDPWTSTCKTYKSSQDEKPKYGNYLCADLNCEYKSKKYKHGESWCADENDGNKGVSENLPGSRHFILSCYKGEIIPTACQDNRDEICKEEEIDEKMHADCISNKWEGEEGCLAQNNKKDCENQEKRYCKWATGITGVDSICVPEFAPGTDEVCELGTFKCTVTYKGSLLEGKLEREKEECKENCHCLEEWWWEDMNEVCNSLGDCGSSENYLGYQGWNLVKELILRG